MVSVAFSTFPQMGIGLALEVARGWLDWFDAQLPGEPLFADVHPERTRSQGVLAGPGFEASHAENILGMSMMIYRRIPEPSPSRRWV